jgi:hypothetical protein
VCEQWVKVGLLHYLCDVPSLTRPFFPSMQVLQPGKKAKIADFSQGDEKESNRSRRRLVARCIALRINPDWSATQINMEIS